MVKLKFTNDVFYDCAYFYYDVFFSFYDVFCVCHLVVLQQVLDLQAGILVLQLRRLFVLLVSLH